MGVDNYGVFLVGLKASEIPDGFKVDVGNFESWAWNNLDPVDGMSWTSINPDGCWDDSLVGIEIASSPSYGYRKVDHVIRKVSRARVAFREVFGVDPDVYILNFQDT